MSIASQNIMDTHGKKKQENERKLNEKMHVGAIIESNHN
jgi:hypothetical protein